MICEDSCNLEILVAARKWHVTEIIGNMKLYSYEFIF